VYAYCVVDYSSYSSCQHGPANGKLGNIRDSLDNCTAFLDSAMSEPVAINFLHPASSARDTTAGRSEGCRCVPW
jgi:hypothetical protein